MPNVYQRPCALTMKTEVHLSLFTHWLELFTLTFEEDLSAKRRKSWASVSLISEPASLLYSSDTQYQDNSWRVWNATIHCVGQ